MAEGSELSLPVSTFGEYFLDLGDQFVDDGIGISNEFSNPIEGVAKAQTMNQIWIELLQTSSTFDTIRCSVSVE